MPEVVHDLLLELEEKDTLLLQYDRDRRLLAQIHEQVHVCTYVTDFRVGYVNVLLESLHRNQRGA